MKLNSSFLTPPLKWWTLPVVATASVASPVWLGNTGRMVALFSSTTNCYIKFGVQGVVATSNDYRMVAGATYAFECAPATDYFSVQRTASDGVITWGVSGAGDPPGVVPVPSNVIDYWHSEAQCSVASWVSQIGGRSLSSATGNQTVGVDGSFFNGRTVGKAFRSPSGGWKGTVSGFALIGQRTYWCGVLRYRDLFTSNGTYGGGGIGIHNSYVGLYPQHGRGGSGNDFRASFDSATAIGVLGFPDTNTHFWEIWADGTNLNLRIDGVIRATSASAAALTQDCVTVAVGLNPGSNIHYSDSSHAFHLYALAKPTEAECTALRNYAISWFGAPP